MSLCVGAIAGMASASPCNGIQALPDGLWSPAARDANAVVHSAIFTLSAADLTTWNAANTTGSGNIGPAVTATIVNPSTCRNMAVIMMAGGHSGATTTRPGFLGYVYADAQLGGNPSLRSIQNALDARQTGGGGATVGTETTSDGAGVTDIAIIAPGGSITATAQGKWVKIVSNAIVAAGSANITMTITLFGVAL